MEPGFLKVTIDWIGLTHMGKITHADLELLIQQGEGTTLEFKESLSSSIA